MNLHILRSHKVQIIYHIIIDNTHEHAYVSELYGSEEFVEVFVVTDFI